MPTSNPPVVHAVGDVVSRIMWYEIPIIRRRSPALDLAAIDFECLPTGAELSTVHTNRIAPPKILSRARAGSSLIGTQPAVASSDVGVPMALNLLEFCIPVWAFSYPTEVRHALEVGDCPKVAVIVVAAVVFIRDVAVAGAARVVFVKIAKTTAATVAVMGATILKGVTTDVRLRIWLRCDFSTGHLEGWLVRISPNGIGGGKSDVVFTIHLKFVEEHRRRL